MLHFSIGRLHAPGRSHSHSDDVQAAPTAAYLSEPGSLQSRQFPAWENLQSSLLRLHTVFRRTAFLRWSQVRHAQAEDHSVHDHEELPHQVGHQAVRLQTPGRHHSQASRRFQSQNGTEEKSRNHRLNDTSTYIWREGGKFFLLLQFHVEKP